MTRVDQATSPPLAEFGGVTPILRVTDLAVSLAYYVDALGFAVDWTYADGFAAVRRGKAVLMLCTDDQGQPGTWVYFGIDDADALYEELRGKGVTVRHPPTNYPWGARELQLADPDGHVLRFASEATDEAPGAWMDAQGKLWFPQADGSWRDA